MKKLFSLAAFAILVSGCAKEDSWYDPVIPLSLKGIEAVNIDNAGEFPTVAASSVKKDAYMIGVRWITSYVLTEDDKFITPPVMEGRYTHASMADNYTKAVVCLTRFNAEIPAGTYVSKFFKEIDRNYLPAGVDEGFVLLVAPDAGEHSFRVEYYTGQELAFSYITPTIEFL